MDNNEENKLSFSHSTPQKIFEVKKCSDSIKQRANSDFGSSTHLGFDNDFPPHMSHPLPLQQYNKMEQIDEDEQE